MDRWRTLALAFGGLWALTLIGLVVALFTGPRAAEPAPAVDVVAADASSGRTVDVVESRSAGQPAARGEDAGGPVTGVATTSRDLAPAWLADASQPLPDDVMERAREQIRSERDEQREDRRDEMLEGVESFIEEEGLNAEQAETLRGTLDDFRDKIDTLRDTMRSGDADFREVRGQMRDARDQLGTDIEAQLGAEGADRFREQVFGGGGPGGPRRPGPL